MESQVLALQKYFKNHPYVLDAIAIITFLFVTLVVNVQMIRYGLNGLGDVRWHIGWVQHFYAELQAGILYPRWLSGTNFGYGSPTFVFYPPLAYYVGSILRFIGLNSQQTMTAVFSVPIFLSGICFYIYARIKWSRIPALVGAVAYQLSPYLITVITPNGALSTAWAIPWIPLGLYFTDKSLVNHKYLIWLTLFTTVVALTHTPSLLIYAIAWFIYLLIQLKDQPWCNVVISFTSVCLGLGIASIYLFPAILEQKYVNIEYQLGSKGGFLTADIKDLLNPKNIIFKNILAGFVLSLIYAFFNLQNPKKLWNILGWTIFVLIVFFMFSNLSEFLWTSNSTLLKVQRSTRISGLFYFGIAVIVTLVARLILDSSWKIKPFLAAIILSLFVVNFHYGYTSTKKSPGLNQPTKGEVFIKSWMEIALFDPYADKLVDVPEYRPLLPNQQFNADVREGTLPNAEGVWLPEIRGGDPYFPVPKLGEPKMSVIEGNANVDITNWGSYTREFTINAVEPSKIRMRTYYYPAWHLEINNQPYDIEMLNDGTIGFNLPSGSYQGKLTYQLTSAFKLGLLASSLSLIVSILLYLKIIKSNKIINI